MNLSWRWHCPLSGYVSVRGSRVYHESSVQCRFYNTLYTTGFRNINKTSIKKQSVYSHDLCPNMWVISWPRWCNIPLISEKYSPKNHPGLFLFLHLLASCVEVNIIKPVSNLSKWICVFLCMWSNPVIWKPFKSMNVCAKLVEFLHKWNLFIFVPVKNIRIR